MLLRALNCRLNYVLVLLVLIVAGGWIAGPSLAQEKTQEKAQESSEREKQTESKQEDAPNKQVPLSDLIRDHGSVIIQTGPFDKVASDIKRLLTDVGYGGLSGYAKSLFPSKKVGINRSSGFTIYTESPPYYSGGVVRFQIADRQALLDALGADRDEFADGAWEDGAGIEHDLGMRIWPWTDSDSAQINDDSFLIGDQGTEFSDGLPDAELLKPRLHPNSIDIIDRAGLSMLRLDAGGYGFDDFEAKEIIDFLELDLSEAEKKWLEDFAEVVRATDIGVVGLQYHEGKALELRSFAQVEKDASFAKLVDLKAAQEPWTADLGFEAENLIASAAFKMDTFNSSAAPRLIPQAVTHGLAPNNLRYLRGGMMQTLLSLCGDSWNELSAARVALYHRDEASFRGELTMFGVLDAKDPEKVLVELQRIASLTGPTQNEERKFQRDEEIRKLVEQLQSEDTAVSDRAYTRIFLVGEPARERLRELRLKTESVALKKRIGHLISTMDRRKNRGHKVSDAMFWSTLSPGLDLKQNVSKLGEFPVHHIEITPDPSKTEEEAASAIQTMAGIFGADWNKVPVVQVNDHFVFMLGSDQVKLQRIVKRTAEGKGELAKQLKGVGHGSKVAQMQAWFHPGKVAELTGQYRPNWQNDTMKKLMETDQRLCWLGLNIEENGLGADFLIPVPQIIPFVFGGF